MSPKKGRSPRLPPFASLAVSLVVLLVILGVIFFEILSERSRPRSAANPTPTFPVSTETGPWASIYFSDPYASWAEDLRGGPDAHLAAAIQEARLSVDAAVMQLDLWSIRDALLEAHRRGVRVRLVVDSDYLEEEEIQELKEAGIEVLGDRREGLMHHKFVIIDREEVWSGSMNLSVNDAYRNHNNLIRIRSERLAEDYEREFEEMFVEDRFGPDSAADTPYPRLSVGGALLEVYFSPDDGTAARLLELIGGARESVYFMTFSFTQDELAAALMERAGEGVSVAGIMDEGQAISNTGGEYENLVRAGLDVRLDANPRSMHHKVLIVDESIVVTGSYNFSNNAERTNDENTLVIHSPEVAARYMEEFRRLYALTE